MTNPWPAVRKQGALWQGEVVSVDPSGNAVTNLRASEVRPLAKTSKMWIEFEKSAATVRGISDTLAGSEPGKLIALEGPGGFVVLAVNQGNAADLIPIAVGDRVNVHFRA